MKVWFFKHNDKLVSTTEEEVAWNHYRKGYEPLGTSNGKKYNEIMKKNKNKTQKHKQECKDLREYIDKLKDKKEELMVDELKDEDHPEVEKVKEKIEEKEQELEDKLKEKGKIDSRIREKAVKAEASIAIKNGFEPPSNQDYMIAEGLNENDNFNKDKLINL